MYVFHICIGTVKTEDFFKSGIHMELWFVKLRALIL